MDDFDRIAARDWLERVVKALLTLRASVLLVAVLDLRDGRDPVPLAVAVLLAAVASYVPLRYWRRVAGTLQRHPAFFAVELGLGGVILALGGPTSPFFAFVAGTAVLAGVLYGWRGAPVFVTLVLAVFESVVELRVPFDGPRGGFAATFGPPAVLVACVAAGAALRRMMDAGVAAEAMLAASERDVAAERERSRLAREMHDSLAKTVQGVRFTASALPARIQRDPEGAIRMARELAQDAARAVEEARLIMIELRDGGGASIGEAVAAEVDAFTRRGGVNVDVQAPADVELPARTRGEVVRIVGEALRNVERHAGARRAWVTTEAMCGELVVEVGDDGCGLDDVDEAALAAGGHFGIVGMRERAAEIGATLAIGAREGGGTRIVLRLPLVVGRPPSASPRALMETVGGRTR